MTYIDSNTPPIPDLNDPCPEDEVIRAADDASVHKLRAAEHGMNNFLTALTVGPHDPRALALARTKMQEAFMWAEKAIREPGGV